MRVMSGLIPARAGNTWAKNIPAQPTWAHPRSRGEHVSQVSAVHQALGSSPLARGARLSHQELRQMMGLIPARAGSTVRRGEAE